MAYQKRLSSKGSSTPQKLAKFDRYIWGIVKRHYIVSETQILRRYPSFNPGVLKGALYRLKDAGWLVLVPSLGGYMTMKDYKERISDGVADE